MKGRAITATIKDKLIHVSFPYCEDTIIKVKAVPGAKWLKRLRVWTIPCTPSAYERLKTQVGVIIPEIEECRSTEQHFWTPKNYRFKTTPYAHQKEGIAFLLRSFSGPKQFSKGAALFCEMGVGKTKIAIDAAEILFSSDKIKRALVVAPLSIVGTWEQELAVHSSKSTWSCALGSKRKRIKALDALVGHSKKLQWVLINIDGLSTVLRELLAAEFDLIVVDESTTIKNRTALRTKLLVDNFSGAPYKVIMSGNPIPKSADEIYSQYLFADTGVFGASYARFMDQYFETDFFNKITTFKDKDKYNAMLHSIAYRKTKQECLDLPPKVYQIELITMSPVQRELYLQMRQEAVAFYEDMECMATVTITKFLRLSQIAGGWFAPTDGQIGATSQPILPNPKLDRLCEIIDEIPANEQVVVWARFQKEIEAIVERLTKAGHCAAAFYGKTSAEVRKDVRNAFRNKAIRVFVGNPSTGGKGLNDLIGATTVIYYSNDYSAENRGQSEDRNHRNGTVKVLYIDLVTAGTIDEQVLDVLRANKDFSEEILNHRVLL